MEIFQPQSLAEALELLSNYKNTLLLAGGTDLLLDIKRKKVNPLNIIDLSQIDDLKEIVENEHEVTIGSMVTFRDLQKHPSIILNFNSLIQCANYMGSPQIRNVATLGGNIINAGAAADSIPCIMSLEGTLVFESKHGIRKVSCEEYFINYTNEKIKEHEILTKIIIPKLYKINGFNKLGKRNSLAIARISSAIGLNIKQNMIQNCSICLGAVGRYPFRVRELEIICIGKNLDWLFSEEVLSILENKVFESIRGRTSMPFKKEAIKGVYQEMIRRTIKDVDLW